MIPSRPIRGRVCTSLSSSSAWVSALAIDVLVAVVERVDVHWLERLDRPERAREVHRARDVFAHHRALDGVARALAEREHAMAAHQHRAGAVLADRLDDAAAELLVAD